MESHSGTRAEFPGFDSVFYAGHPGHGFICRSDLSVEDAFRLIRGELKPMGDIWLRWAMGRKEPTDFLWTTLAVLFVVSDRVVQILQSKRFSGWTTYPVVVVGPTGTTIPGYSGLSVVGRCGPLQPERSIRYQKPGPVGNTIEVFKGQFFDENLWDGSDIFMPTDGTGLVFVLDRVKRALESSKLKGVRFARADLHERLFA
jgi:hypothetical protein